MNSNQEVEAPKEYRAVLHTPGKDNIESIWFDTEAEATNAGEMGVLIYSTEKFTTESRLKTHFKMKRR